VFFTNDFFRWFARCRHTDFKLPPRTRTNLVSRCATGQLGRRAEKIGRAPECFVTKHRLDLGFLRGETETKRLAGGWNLTE